VTATLQVRSWTRHGGHRCHYYAGVRPERAVELALAADAAACCQHVDYYSVHDDAYAPYDDPPLLIADHEGRPAVTIRTDDWAPSCGRAAVANHSGTRTRDRPGVGDVRQVITAR
jgi:hypothetical protein